jgi:isopenicillin-N N-acyltransferase-like protein
MSIGFMEIEVDGDHRAAGELIGEAARELIQESIAYYEEHHEVMAGMSFRSAEAESGAYLEEARRWLPDIVAELEGMAAGAGVPVSKLAVPNLGEEFTCSDEAALLAGLDPQASGGQHCTTLAIATAGRILVGHNEDWYSGDTTRNVLLRMRTADGTRIVAITPACLLAASGINSHGIATAANTVFCTDVRRGVPNNLIRRWMLEADSLESARERACLPARARGCNHVMADAHGRIWDVEASAASSVTLESGSWFVHTNHYLHESMEALQMALPLESSRARLARARGLVADGIRCGRDPYGIATEVLADHGDAGLEICNHEDGALLPGDRQSTTASMIWDLEAMAADVCAGPPCENRRVRVTLS